MTRNLAIPQNQMRAIIRAAQKEGARVEVKIGEAVITVIPDDNNGKIPLVDRPETSATLTPLQRWKVARDAGKAYGNS